MKTTCERLYRIEPRAEASVLIEVAGMHTFGSGGLLSINISRPPTFQSCDDVIQLRVWRTRAPTCYKRLGKESDVSATCQPTAAVPVCAHFDAPERKREREREGIERERDKDSGGMGLLPWHRKRRVGPLSLCNAIALLCEESD